MADDMHFKDTILDQLSRTANVAQFVSFSPHPVEQRYSRVTGFEPNHRFPSSRAAIEALLESSPVSSVNLRSFEPDQPRSRVFIYGLNDAAEVLSQLENLTEQNLYTIVNETIDVDDGGVSGVAFGGVLEFAPGSTPRCVESPGTAEFPIEVGLAVIRSVYGFTPELPSAPSTRTEFSIHPISCGFNQTHTILWEQEETSDPKISPEIKWPNKFSRHLGDKAFGLLAADAIGLRVPRTTVISRVVAPFSFGMRTGSDETWVRTCPIEQVPGRYATQKGWLDPFQLMQDEDPMGDSLASLLAQDGVHAEYSGALLTDGRGKVLIEGRKGSGEDFMQGVSGPERLSAAVERSVMEVYQKALVRIGPVRMEWVFDGDDTWVVQLHAGASASIGRTIYPGAPKIWREVDASQGIEAIRDVIGEVKRSGEGIIVRGSIGMTSHIADLLRKAGIPSRIEGRAATRPYDKRQMR